MPTEYEYLSERIAKCEVLIATYEDAILELATGAVSYTLDTGQTRQTVTRAQLGEMRLLLRELEISRDTLLARRDGVGAIGRPVY